MARALSQSFIDLLKDPANDILQTISRYRDLSVTFSPGNALKVYYLGCRVLTITEHALKYGKSFKALSPDYFDGECPFGSEVRVSNLTDYLKSVIGFLNSSDKITDETAVRQEIARVNNRSREANDTDYFIVDQEHRVVFNGKQPTFDLVALYWPSERTCRKQFDVAKSKLEIVIFELKQGGKAVGSSSNSKSKRKNADLKSHLADFNRFMADPTRVLNFKRDIIRMFVQQCSLTGFYNQAEIPALKHAAKKSDAEIEEIAKSINVRFGLIISDYNGDSTVLSEQLGMMEGDFLFAKSSYMGYGLYRNRMSLGKM